MSIIYAIPTISKKRKTVPDNCRILSSYIREWGPAEKARNLEKLDEKPIIKISQEGNKITPPKIVLVDHFVLYNPSTRSRSLHFKVQDLSKYTQFELPYEKVKKEHPMALELYYYNNQNTR